VTCACPDSGLDERPRRGSGLRDNATGTLIGPPASGPLALTRCDIGGDFIHHDHVEEPVMVAETGRRDGL
jgi:hypothetical protein